MPNPDAQEPTFFQDAVMPKDKPAKRSFDIRKEFGEVAGAELTELSGRITKLLEHVRSSKTPDIEALALRRHAVKYRVLVGHNMWNEEEQKHMTQNSRYLFEQALAATTLTYPYFTAASHAADHRILTGELFWTEDERNRTMQPLADHIRRSLEKKYFRDAAEVAVPFLVLGGERFWTPKNQKEMEENFKIFALRSGRVDFERVGRYRLLKAHQFRFTKDGIEIIDTPPPPSEKNTPPMPEERTF